MILHKNEFKDFRFPSCNVLCLIYEILKRNDVRQEVYRGETGYKMTVLRKRSLDGNY